MPTAGRLAGAVIFGLFGWYLAGITTPYFPLERPPSYWLPAVSLISLIVGWQVCGSRAGRGYNPAIGIGLTSSFVIGFCSLFLVSFNQMVANSLRLRYDGAMDAVVDVFDQMLVFATYFFDITIITTLVVGGVICAWVVEYFGKRYP